MGELLYTVKDIFSSDGYLKQHGKEFYNIPLYQRGYKWKPKHAEKLLVDINNFNQHKDKFYCLQNITLVPPHHQDGFNVVDGQQRLVTLTLLLCYLGERELVKDKVKFPDFSIRHYTNVFLNTTLHQSVQELQTKDWEEFLTLNEDFDHQDIFHLFQVNRAIGDWFLRMSIVPGFSVEMYKEKVLNHVKFIVNNITSPISEEKIFGNLNSKRIPLDGADLVRAILVTNVAKERSSRDETINDILMVNERRVKLGWEIDQVSNWWAQEKVSGYFTEFCSLKSDTIGNEEVFDTVKHPINLLYKLYAEIKGGEVLTLEFIESYNNNHEATSLYKAILKVHNTLKDWFQDKRIYHYLGYLFFQTEGTSFKSIWTLWEEKPTRNEFLDALKIRISKSIQLDDELIDFSDTTINWYYDNKYKKFLSRGLILMDVIHALKGYTTHMPYFAFSKSNNDIEHIFPQTPKKPEQKQAYIEFLNKHIVKQAVDKFDLLGYDDKKEDETYQLSMDTFIDDQIKGYSIHSIGNLVFLFFRENRSYGNASYAEKRSRVIQYHNKGNYIQPHTFQVFVRYFNDQKNNNLDLEIWSEPDIKNNAKAISDTIQSFLK
ncbi:DUF262 domain-containing protein [soil metagenome]